MGATISKARKKRRSSSSFGSPIHDVATQTPETVKVEDPLQDILLQVPARFNSNNQLDHTSSSSDNNALINVSLVFGEEDLDIGFSDFFSTATIDIISIIFSYLAIEDICTIQRVSRFWCKTLEANDIWKVIVRKESKNWTGKAHEYVMKCVRAEVDSGDFVRWKELLRDYYRNRDCCKCGRLYRQCFNTPAACVRHSGIRDLVEDRGIPSGVYWLCCLEKQKTAPGCTVGGHEEKRPNNSNFNNNNPFSKYRHVLR